jgi:hypothetical protein
MTSKKENEGKKHIYNDRIVDRPDRVHENDPAMLRKREEAKKALAELGIGPPAFYLKPEE